MHIETITHADPRWLDCIEADPETHFFQHPCWSKALSDHVHGMEPAHLLVEDGNRRSVLPLIRLRHRGSILYSLFSLPLGTFGGLVGTLKPTPNQIKDVLDSLSAPACCKIVISFHTDNAAVHLASPNHLKTISSSIIPLDIPYERIEKERFSANKRKLVHRGLHRGIEIRRDKTPEVVAAYLDLEKLVEKEKHWAIRFPEPFIRTIIAFSQSDLWTAWFKGRICCGVLSFRSRVDVTAWQGIFDRTYADAHRSQPMNFLYASMIRYYQEAGFSELDLGHSIGIKSLESYKAGFGATTRNLHYLLRMHPLYSPYYYLSNLIRHVSRGAGA